MNSQALAARISSSPTTPRPCFATPTASSTSPCRRRQLELVKLAAKAGIVHVIGTTGLSAPDEAAIREAAKKAVIVKSGNMSLGVNLLAALVKRVAKTLDEFDIEIVEMHHNKKIDAPSGLRCCSAAPRKTWRASSISVRCARATAIPARVMPEISVLRRCAAAPWSADHTVMFADPAERIELSHKAEDRMIFARGAVKAAMWARDQKPGLYSMADVLGLGDF